MHFNLQKRTKIRKKNKEATSDSDEVDLENFLNSMYQALMQKHGWTINQIDEQDFFKTLEIELGDFGANEPPTAYVEEVLGL